MKNYEYFVDGDKLSLKVDNLTDEKHIAQGLQDTFNQLRRHAYNTVEVDSELLHKFQQLSEDIDGLVRFYSRLEEAMDSVAYDVKFAVRKIETMLNDSRIEVEGMINPK